MSLKKIYRMIYSNILRRIDGAKYAKKIGVNMHGIVHIYGKIAWGTEPWIISLGDNVHITDGVKFITHDGGTLLFRKIVPDLDITKPIIVGNNVYFGNNVIVLPGVKIGNNVVIGAGAIVSKDIPDNSLAVGIPARVIKSIDEYLEKARTQSTHLGTLRGQEKDKALMDYYGYTGGSKGIYF